MGPTRAEEGMGSAVSARVHNAVALFGPLLETDGVETRQHDTVCSTTRSSEPTMSYWSTRRFTGSPRPTHQSCTYAEPKPGGMFATYGECFECVWADAAPTKTTTPAVRVLTGGLSRS
jgi:hypothetical protein